MEIALVSIIIVTRYVAPTALAVEQAVATVMDTLPMSHACLVKRLRTSTLSYELFISIVDINQL